MHAAYGGIALGVRCRRSAIEPIRRQIARDFRAGHRCRRFQTRAQPARSGSLAVTKSVSSPAITTSWTSGDNADDDPRAADRR